MCVVAGAVFNVCVVVGAKVHVVARFISCALRHAVVIGVILYTFAIGIKSEELQNRRQI